MTTLTYKGRLPGVVCEAALPRRESNPLRLDVTGFVGFAERGPLNTPVFVEDISQYRAIFGGDLLVARTGGLPIYAYLPQAVQSFFDNGGRRCYVVRVANERDARPNRFEMPGMVTWDGTDLRRVVAPAAWVGRWSDRMHVGTQLHRTPLRLPAHADHYRPNLAANSVALDLEVPSVTLVQPGDVLALHFANDLTLLLRAATVEVTNAAPATLHDLSITVTATATLPLRLALEPPPDVPAQVERLDALGWQALPGALSALAAGPEGVAFSLPEVAPVQEGDLLRLTFAGVTLLFPVARVDWAYDATSDTRFQRVLSRQLLEPILLTAISGTLTQVDYLGFDLLIREGNETLEVWPDTRFGNWTSLLATGTVRASELGQRSLRLGAPAEANFFPLGMDALPVFNRPLPDPESSGKDGLDAFEPAALFLDPQFTGYGARTIMRRAEELLYLSNPPQPLIKLHSLIPVQEVALIAVPDLVHRPWHAPEPLTEPSEPPPPPPSPPDLSRFQDCPDAEPVEPEPERPTSEPLEVVALANDLLPEQFAQQLALAPVTVPAWEYGPSELDALVGVQETLINLCAARADMLAVLSVPEHFARRELVDWQQQLTGIPAFRDGNPLSYAAIYHGWPQIREPATPEVAPLRNVPPDGAICGMIAARESRRGPWIAPANESLRGVVGLTPVLNEDDWLVLFDRQINLIRQQPGRFTLMSAHTLSSDYLFWQISVRRLLILLRKLVLREGDQYVFEPNDTRFQRRVQIGFERRLNRLLEAGGLAAFQVITGDAVNTRNDYDNGRLIIEIKVAPSQPVEFISVVLLRSGENLLQVIER